MAIETKSGADQWQAALGGNSGTEEPLSQASEDDETVVRAEESTVDGQESGESRDTPSDSPESEKLAEASKPSPAKQGTSAKEVIAVTDESGRRRKIEIDYSDRAAIKKAHLEAAGMRKFQAERDQALKRFQEGESKRKDLESNWQTLETAFQQGGVEGLVDLLEGRKGAYRDRISKELEKAKFLERASPEEIEQFNARESAEKLRRDYERLQKDNEKFKNEVIGQREAAELKEVQSRVHPVFDKYRFAGKLGDEQDEHMFDEMLWNSALNRLKEYETQGLDLSPELVDREFREVQSAIRRRINVAADKKVSNVMKQKKQEATENVQAQIKSGYNQKSNEERLREAIKSGNSDTIFKNWSSFKNILGGSRK